MSDAMFSVLEKLLSKPIAFHRVFAEIGGGATEGLFLSQAYYWSFLTSDADGWFYKTIDEWHGETALTRREQEVARKTLINKKVLEVEKRGVPCKLYYKVNRTVLYKLIIDIHSSEVIIKSATSDKLNDNVYKQNCQYVQQSLLDVTNNIYTENTTAITLESEDAHETNAVEKFAEEKRIDAITVDLIIEAEFVGEEEEIPHEGKYSAASSTSYKTQHNSCEKVEQWYKQKYVSRQELAQIFIPIWQQESPEHFAKHVGMDSKLEQSMRAVLTEYGIDVFRAALTYARESDERFYRKEKFTLRRFLNGNHVSECAEKHLDKIQNDPEYRRRVTGISETTQQEEDDYINELFFGGNK